MRRTEELILYRGFYDDTLFFAWSDLIRRVEKGGASFGGIDRAHFFDGAHRLISIAAGHGFSGNLWQAFLTLSFVCCENPYALSCEIRTAPQGSLRSLAASDLSMLREYFRFDLSRLFAALEVDALEELTAYRAEEDAGALINRRIRDSIMALAKELADAPDDTSFQRALERFYEKYGTGRFGLHKAFCVEECADGPVIRPIRRIAHVDLSDLVGYETAKAKLIENTEAFLQKKPANNCLLYGDAGTGKSSSIKAIANRYFEDGLRLIELYKHQIRLLPAVIQELKERNYRFILYMDDLSFEDFETEYKYLKAVIEGGLEKKPENILIYATSNRRHLIREGFSDREDDDIHHNDTVQEKQSLAARFGVSIYYGAPTPEEFREIVKTLAKRSGITMPEQELLLEANRWEISHGGLSGRTAQQFINHLLGKAD